MIPRPPRSTPFPSPTLFRSSRGPVRGDALVDRDANQLDLAPAPQELDQEGRRRARILAAAHADRDALVAAKIDLGSELTLRSPFDEAEEVVATEVFPAVTNPLDRGGRAPVADHDRSHPPEA